MFVKLRSLDSFYILSSLRCIKCFTNVSKVDYNVKQIRLYCSPVENRDVVVKRTFEDLVNHRRLEARRSFVVQVFSEQSCWDLFEYCNSISPINFMQHYSLSDNYHFVVSELKNGKVEDFLHSCRHVEDLETLPVKSPFLWFKTSQGHKKKKSKRNEPFPSFKPPNELELSQLLCSAESMSDQMRLVYEYTRLDETGIRLRFLAARQVELALNGLFPNCAVLPFGSSVNGFGKVGCDLDLGLRYSPVNSNSNDSRLVFQGKEGGQNGRAHLQRQIEMFADILHIFLPGCSNVRRILKARVPIVKYSQDYTGLDCDLSMSDLTGLYMSELLWLYGTIDCRVRPLVFTVRRWAQCIGLTSLVPGKFITNFTLTALVIYYLQTEKILPTYNILVKMAKPGDARFAGEVNCTFLRDYSRLPINSDDSDSSVLLNGFFEFYSNFDYESYGICIRSGSPITKPDHSPLYLVNPLEPSLNVSRNVSPEELTRLKVECRNASWHLQSSSSIISIFKSLQSNQQKSVSKTGKRMVSLKHLFKSQNIS